MQPIRTILAATAMGAVLAAGLWARPGTATETVRPPHWEYRQVTFHGDYGTLETALAAAGADGFELVLISPQDTVAIFKRPMAR